jgi:hypothetical protein
MTASNSTLAHKLSSNSHWLDAEKRRTGALRYARGQHAEQRLIDVRLFLAIGERRRLIRKPASAATALVALDLSDTSGAFFEKTFSHDLGFAQTEWAHGSTSRAEPCEIQKAI